MIALIETCDNEYITLFEDKNICKETSNNPFLKYLFFIKNNKLIGYLAFEYIYDRIEIDNLFVIEVERNNKIGSHLLEYLINYAELKNVKNITLEVRKNNTVAITLYKKYGFNSVTIREKYYDGIDGILMEKEMI